MRNGLALLGGGLLGAAGVVLAVEGRPPAAVRLTPCVPGVRVPGRRRLVPLQHLSLAANAQQPNEPLLWAVH